MAAARNRRIILTGSLVVATITGSLYGASLKMDRDAEQEAKKRQAATTEEKINALLGVREGLVAKKITLENQIRDIEKRQEEKAARMNGGGNNEDGRTGR